MKTQHVVGEVRKALTPAQVAEVLLKFRGQRNEIENQLIRGTRTTDQVQNFIDHRPVVEDNICSSKFRLFVLRYNPTDSYALCLARNEDDLLRKYNIHDNAVGVEISVEGIRDERATRQATRNHMAVLIAQKVAHDLSSSNDLQRYEGVITIESYYVSDREVMVLRKLGLIMKERD